MANIQNDRDALLQSATFRIVAIENLSLVTNVGSFVLASGASTLTPASATLTTSITTYTKPTYTWYTIVNGVETLVSGQTGPNLVVSASSFKTLVGTGTSATYKVVISQAGYPSKTLETTILLIREGDKGDKGDPGLSGQSVKAYATSFAFNYTTGGTFSPDTITCRLDRSAGINGTESNSSFVWSVVSGTFTGNLTTINSSTGAFPAFTPSSMTTDSVTFKCTYTVSTAGSAYLGQSFTDYVTVTKVRPGQKTATASAFRWLISAPGTAPTQEATFTWSNSAVSSYPSGWSSSPPASPGSGYVLYELTVRISEPDGSATSTAFNWNTGVFGTIGYRVDGSIGPQGPGSRIAYMVTTSSTPPALGATQPVSGDTLPNGTARPGSTALNTWSATPKTVLAEGEFMYQSDGIYDPASNTTTWQAAYLSNLKVGSLSALSAKLGVVEVASGGSLYSGKTTPSSTSAGFYLGYSGATHTFFIGNSGDTKSMKWDGTDLVVKGGTIEGSTIRTASSGARYILSEAAMDGYDSSNTLRVSIDLASGNALFKSGNAFSAVNGAHTTGIGVTGVSTSGPGVVGNSESGVGVRGSSASSGTAVEGVSVSGFGGVFSGNATRANLKLPALTALPTNRDLGAVCFYNGNLCIANGTDWYTFSNMVKLT